MKGIKNIILLAFIAVLAACGSAQKDARSSNGGTISPQEFQLVPHQLQLQKLNKK